jgi:hypothetical protein
MLPLRETKMDKIPQSSEHASPTIRTDTSPLSARLSDNVHLVNTEIRSKEMEDDPDEAVGNTKETVTDDPGEAEQTLGAGISIKKRTWKKPKDKPKRPLSSYNIYFRKCTTIDSPELDCSNVTSHRNVTGHLYHRT